MNLNRFHSISAMVVFLPIAMLFSISETLANLTKCESVFSDILHKEEKLKLPGKAGERARLWKNRKPLYYRQLLSGVRGNLLDEIQIWNRDHEPVIYLGDESPRGFAEWYAISEPKYLNSVKNGSEQTEWTPEDRTMKRLAEEKVFGWVEEFENYDSKVTGLFDEATSRRAQIAILKDALRRIESDISIDRSKGFEIPLPWIRNGEVTLEEEFFGSVINIQVHIKNLRREISDLVGGMVIPGPGRHGLIIGGLRVFRGGELDELGARQAILRKYIYMVKDRLRYFQVKLRSEGRELATDRLKMLEKVQGLLNNRELKAPVEYKILRRRKEFVAEFLNLGNDLKDFQALIEKHKGLYDKLKNQIPSLRSAGVTIGVIKRFAKYANFSKRIMGPGLIFIRPLLMGTGGLAAVAYVKEQVFGDAEKRQEIAEANSSEEFHKLSMEYIRSRANDSVRLKQFGQELKRLVYSGELENSTEKEGVDLLVAGMHDKRIRSLVKDYIDMVYRRREVLAEREKYAKADRDAAETTEKITRLIIEGASKILGEPVPADVPSVTDQKRPFQQTGRNNADNPLQENSSGGSRQEPMSDGPAVVVNQ